MKKLRLTYFFSSLFILGGVVWIAIYHYSGYSSLYHDLWPIDLTDSNIPFTNIQIEGKNYPVGIDLGSHLALDLESQIIANISKTPKGVVKFGDFSGRPYKSAQYLLPKITIGSFDLKKVLTAEQDHEYGKNTLLWSGDDKSPVVCGFIGRDILQRFNLLLDIPNHRFFASNNLQQLAAEGYEIHTWIKAPFKMTKYGLLFDINTSLGLKNMLLDSGSTYSLMPIDEVPENLRKKDEHDLLTYTSEKFEIAGKEFEPCTLLLLNMSSKISGVLGMNFIKAHPIYLDFKNKTAYIYPSSIESAPLYHDKWDVAWKNSKPYIQAQIGSRICFLMITAQTAGDIALKDEMLNTLETTPLETMSIKNLKGEHYSVRIYRLPSLAISHATFSELNGAEMNEKGSFIVLDQSEIQTDGDKEEYLQLLTLRDYNLLFAYKKSVIYLSSDLLKLQNEGYFIHKWHRSSFTYDKNTGIFLECKTPLGYKKFLLDPGAPVSYLKNTAISSPIKVYTASSFEIGDHNFGPVDLHLCDLDREIEYFDGVLGIDFLKKNSLYLDMKRNIVFIDPSS